MSLPTETCPAPLATAPWLSKGRVSLKHLKCANGPAHLLFMSVCVFWAQGGFKESVGREQARPRGWGHSPGCSHSRASHCLGRRGHQQRGLRRSWVVLLSDWSEGVRQVLGQLCKPPMCRRRGCPLWAGGPHHWAMCGGSLLDPRGHGRRHGSVFIGMTSGRKRAPPPTKLPLHPRFTCSGTSFSLLCFQEEACHAVGTPSGQHGRLRQRPQPLLA